MAQTTETVRQRPAGPSETHLREEAGAPTSRGAGCGRVGRRVAAKSWRYEARRWSR